MTIPINNIEHYFDENLVLIAENILENKQVHALAKHEQGVWTADVQGFEVEVQIKSSKIVAYTCECPKGNESCSHVVATIMLIRRRIIQKNLEQQEKKERSFIPNKLNITAILKQISDDNIREFVRNYARTDKKFSTALKAAFIHKVDVADDNKYYTYLRSILPAKEYKNPSFNSGRKLLNAYTNLLDGSEECFVLGEFLEVWLCVSSILNFHYPLSDKSNIQKHNFEPLILKTIQILSKAYLNTNALELKEKIELFTIEEIHKVHYRLDSSAFMYWLKLLYKFNKPDTDRISTLCHKILSNGSIELQKKAAIFALYIGLIKKWKQLKDLKQWLKSTYLPPALLLKAAENLYLQGNGNDAKWLLKNISTKTLSTEESLLLKQGLFETEIQSDQYEAAIKIGLECFRIKPEKLYFTRLFQTQSSAQKEEIKSLFIKELENISDKNIKARIQCQLSIADADINELIATLERSKDLNLYLEFLEDISLDYQSKHKKLIQILLKEYLKEHFGEKPAIKIRGLLKEYNKIGNNELRSVTENYIQKNYASRKTLIDEILYY